MTVRDYSRSIAVNRTSGIETLKTLKGERVYLLIENNSGSAVVVAPDTAPTIDPTSGTVLNGITVPANARYERYKPFCPQNDLFVGGTTAALQSVQITEGYEE